MLTIDFVGCAEELDVVWRRKKAHAADKGKEESDSKRGGSENGLSAYLL